MPGTTRYLIRLAYRGEAFAGWQKQPGRRTAQGDLESALAALYGQPVRTVGAGRTDAGVHATGQVAHFDAPPHIPPDGVRAALARLLPDDLRALAVRRAPPGFHALNDARGKRYRYRLAWGAPLDPWEALRVWEVPRAPDLAAMIDALLGFAGEHDFAAFALAGHSGTGRRGTVRRVTAAKVVARGRRAAVVIEGDGFLRGMVRRMVGALVEVGRGAAERSWIGALLSDATTRPPAPTAPAHGLTLEHVFYPPRQA